MHFRHKQKGEHASKIFLYIFVSRSSIDRRPCIIIVCADVKCALIVMRQREGIDFIRKKNRFPAQCVRQLATRSKKPTSISKIIREIPVTV